MSSFDRYPFPLDRWIQSQLVLFSSPPSSSSSQISDDSCLDTPGEFTHLVRTTGDSEGDFSGRYEEELAMYRRSKSLIHSLLDLRVVRVIPRRLLFG